MRRKRSSTELSIKKCTRCQKSHYRCARDLAYAMWFWWVPGAVPCLRTGWKRLLKQFTTFFSSVRRVENPHSPVRSPSRPFGSFFRPIGSPSRPAGSSSRRHLRRRARSRSSTPSLSPPYNDRFGGTTKPVPLDAKFDTAKCLNGIHRVINKMYEMMRLGVNQCDTHA